MDEFERRLSASMKNAAEHPVNLERGSRRYRWVTAGGIGAVVVAGVIVAVYLATGGSSEPEGVPLGPPMTFPALQCPEQLAQASDETHGFGPGQFATEDPRLPKPDAGVICIYTAKFRSQGRDGSVLSWVFGSAGFAGNSPSPGTETQISPAQLSELAADLSRVEPPHPRPGFGCTDELGPRYVLLYQAGDRLVGVVVDGYGCNEVRLTADLSSTVAGTDASLGTGVFYGPRSLIEHLRAFTSSSR